VRAASADGFHTSMIDVFLALFLIDAEEGEVVTCDVLYGA
jgi:hypothetical protein